VAEAVAAQPVWVKGAWHPEAAVAKDAWHPEAAVAKDVCDPEAAAVARRGAVKDALPLQGVAAVPEKEVGLPEVAAVKDVWHPEAAAAVPVYAAWSPEVAAVRPAACGAVASAEAEAPRLREELVMG
jgi:hypothetical protein